MTNRIARFSHFAEYGTNLRREIIGIGLFVTFIGLNESSIVVLGSVGAPVPVSPAPQRRADGPAPRTCLKCSRWVC
jgi:xanthine/uracil/vitamin C permease (AzgA family)